MNSDKVKNETPVSLSKRTPSPAASQACEKCGSLFKNVKLHQARGKCSSGEKKSPVGNSSPASVPNSPLESPSKRKTPQKSSATSSPKNEEDSAAKDELLEELDLEQANVTEEVKMISKKIFSCLDILRSIGITGQSALKNIVAFLILKMSEPHIKSGAISFSRPEDYAIDDVFPPEGVPEEELYRTYDCDYIKYACFSELMKVDDRLVRGYVEKLFRLLEKHKLFGKIFSTRTINIDDNNVVCRGVIRKINEIPVETVRTDVIGDAYEFVLSRFGENKDFAQFFTPDWLRTTILEIVSPEMGKTVYDPAAGSGGFLISAVKYWNGLCAASGQTPDLLGFSEPLIPTKRLCTARLVHAMHGKHVLGEINTSGQNSHGLPLPDELMRNRTLHRGTQLPFAASRLVRDREVPFIR